MQYTGNSGLRTSYYIDTAGKIVIYEINKIAGFFITIVHSAYSFKS